ELQPSLEVADLQTLLWELRSNTWQILALTEGDKTKVALNEGYELHKHMRKQEESLLPKIHTQELRERFQDARAAMAEYVKAREDLILAPVSAGRREEAVKNTALTGLKLDRAVEALEKTVELSRASAKQKYIDSQAIYTSNRLILIAVSLG